jgi:hypothetical protein
LIALGLIVGLLAAPAWTEPLTLDWATFAVEREHFREEADSGRYGEEGEFAGVGLMYVSPGRTTLKFEGLSRIELLHLGQGPATKYEFRFETFQIKSFFSIGPGEYAFEAIREGPFARRLTGTLSISTPKGAMPTARVDTFVAEEHGTTLEGIMNRFSLASSAEAKALLQKYDDVFFGGYAAFEPEE